MEKNQDKILNKIRNLPFTPGCHLYKNKYDVIIYIGKSKSLNQRVKQYFTGIEKKEGKLKLLVNEIFDLEYIVTETEMDAIFLECELIKKHLPKYNRLMIKSPKFVYLKIDTNMDYPLISVVREKEIGVKNCYFGLFYSEKEAYEAIEILNHIYHTPICNNKKEKRKPCFHYYLNKCMGPCSNKITKEEYQKTIQKVISFLCGKEKKIIKNIEKEMMVASKDLNFEKAALLRNQLNDITSLLRKQNRFHVNFELNSLFVFLRPFYQSKITLLYIHKNCVLHRVDFEKLEDVTIVKLMNFLEEIYDHKFNMEDSNLKVVYILEIYCDKYFVPIYRMAKKENCAIRLCKDSVNIDCKEFEKGNSYYNG